MLFMALWIVSKIRYAIYRIEKIDMRYVVSKKTIWDISYRKNRSVICTSDRKNRNVMCRIEKADMRYILSETFYSSSVPYPRRSFWTSAAGSRTSSKLLFNKLCQTTTLMVRSRVPRLLYDLIWWKEGCIPHADWYRLIDSERIILMYVSDVEIASIPCGTGPVGIVCPSKSVVTIASSREGKFALRVERFIGELSLSTLSGC